MDNESQSRNSTFEILRILGMFLIVASHAFPDPFRPLEDVTLASLLTNVLLSGGKVGAALFFIISGYFLYSSKKISFSRIKNLEVKALFVSYLFLFLAIITNCSLLYEEVSFPLINGLDFIDFIIKSPIFLTFYRTYNSFFIKEALPTLSFSYWFVSDYIILELLRPFLFKKLGTGKKLIIALGVLFSCFILAPTILWGFGINLLIEPFLALFYYLLGGYFKNAKKVTSPSKANASLIVAFLSYLAITFLVSISQLIKIPFAKSVISYLNWFDSPLVLVCSLFLFLWARNKKPFENTIVNQIASLTIYVYLIHENVWARTFLFQVIFHLPMFQEDSLLPLYILVSSLITFVFCSLTGYLIQIKLPRIKETINPYFSAKFRRV